ncbi:MAG: hypothetical protein ACK491_12340, partial [Pseudanabaena sp.]
LMNNIPSGQELAAKAGGAIAKSKRKKRMQTRRKAKGKRKNFFCIINHQLRIINYELRITKTASSDES